MNRERRTVVYGAMWALVTVLAMGQGTARATEDDDRILSAGGASLNQAARRVEGQTGITPANLDAMEKSPNLAATFKSVKDNNGQDLMGADGFPALAVEDQFEVPKGDVKLAEFQKQANNMRAQFNDYKKLETQLRAAKDEANLVILADNVDQARRELSDIHQEVANYLSDQSKAKPEEYVRLPDGALMSSKEITLVSREMVEKARNGTPSNIAGGFAVRGPGGGFAAGGFRAGGWGGGWGWRGGLGWGGGWGRGGWGIGGGIGWGGYGIGLGYGWGVGGFYGGWYNPWLYNNLAWGGCGGCGWGYGLGWGINGYGWGGLGWGGFGVYSPYMWG